MFKKAKIGVSLKFELRKPWVLVELGILKTSLSCVVALLRVKSSFNWLKIVKLHWTFFWQVVIFFKVE